jgi:hypothetical protein
LRFCRISVAVDENKGGIKEYNDHVDQGHDPNGIYSKKPILETADQKSEEKGTDERKKVSAAHLLKQ